MLRTYEICGDECSGDWFGPVDGAAPPLPFVLGMRQLAAGVSVVTTGEGDDRSGMTASAVCSLSVEPPSLVVCLNRSSWTWGRLVPSGRFCVNVLGRHHEELARVFAGRMGLYGEARFNAGTWRQGRLEVPVLADALVAFECDVASTLDYATHCVVVGVVREVHVREDRPDPLVYHDRTFCGVARDLERALPHDLGGFHRTTQGS